MVADLVVGFKALRESFPSRVHKSRPDVVDVDYLDGPLKYLHNNWRFRPDGKGGSFVEFCVDFAFKSHLFDMLAGGRKSVVWGKSVSVGLELGGRRRIKKKKNKK